MKASVVLLLCALASVGCARVLLENDCDGKKCGPKTPPYTVLGHEGATEIREYENATWAISFGKSIFGIDVAAALATKGVFGYFAGENNQHLKIPPSIPLITSIAGPPPPPPPHPPKNGSHPHPPHLPKNGSHPDSPHHPRNSSDPDTHHPHPHPPPPPPPGNPLVLAGAFIPLEGDVPKPDNRHVKLIKTNTSKVYVHEFGGFAISWLIKKEIEHLKVDLKDLGVKTWHGKFFVATYDGPWKLIGRKNEIWWTEVPRPPHQPHHKPHDTSPFEDGDPNPESMDQPTPSGFAAMEPMILFPEELPPPPKTPEGGLGGPEFLGDELSSLGLPENELEDSAATAEEAMLQSSQQWSKQTFQAVETS